MTQAAGIGKTVIISGAGIGIGKATAEAFARAGYRVIVTDVLADEGEAVAAAIESAGGMAQFHAMDVADTAAINAVIAAVERQYGALDCVVCNAGIAKTLPLATLTDAAWDTTLDIDLKGMMRMIRAAAPAMRAAKSGSIVCLASIVGTQLGWGEHVPYSAAKGGVAGLVRGIAIELAGDGIRANAIAPGLIRTAQTLDPVNSVGDEGLAAFAPKVPLGRIGDPSDIADVAVFLASDKARYITGQTITVDGGLMVAL
jgi:3-oxoacyl-[acyl-carrier protein] reductase